MKDLIHAKLKKIVKLEDIIKNVYLNYKSKRWKPDNFDKYSLPYISFSKRYTWKIFIIRICWS